MFRWQQSVKSEGYVEGSSLNVRSAYHSFIRANTSGKKGAPLEELANRWRALTAQEKKAYRDHPVGSTRRRWKAVNG